MTGHSLPDQGRRWAIRVCPVCDKAVNSCPHVEFDSEEPVVVEVVPASERDRLRAENERLRNAMAQVEARAVLMQRGVWSQSAVGNMGRALDGIAKRSLANDERRNDG